MLVLAVLVGLCARPSAGQSATGTIVGHVVEARTGAPLAAVLVQLEATGAQMVTDPDGRFEWSGIAAGAHRVLVSAVGFGLVRVDVMVIANEVTTVTIPVADGASTYVESVAVSGDRFRETQPGAASQAVLGSRELLALRGVIADDPFRAVQVLPGVAAGDDFRAEFAVRGLGPAHVGLSIDDVDSRLLFHTVRGVSDTGSLALINSDILEDATLLSGAHAQTLGAHLGARLDFRSRDGARDRLRLRTVVSGSATTFVGEGPLRGEQGSWLVAARKSYIDWLLRRVDSGIGGTFGFADGQAKLTLTPAPAHVVRLSMIAGRSELDEDDASTLNAFDRGQSRTIVGNAQWRFTPSSALALSQQVSVVDNRYRNRVVDGRAREEGGDRELTWRGKAEWAPAPSHFVQAGGQWQAIDAERVDRRFVSPTAAVTALDAHVSTSTRAAWLSYRVMLAERASLSAGARADDWRQIAQTAVSPWLLVEWPLDEATRLRTGIAVQRQAPSTDDVLLARSGDTLAAEQARIADIGIERRLPNDWRALATVFHRRESERLRLMNAELKVADGVLLRPTAPFIDNALEGTAHGVELTLERRAPAGVSGWMSYAWGRAESRDVETGERYDGDWDQRHTLNLNASYRWSARTALSMRFRYGSNFPLQGYYAPFDADRHLVVSARNTSRLPAYARLDARADRTFTYRRSRLTLFAEVVNLLNRANARLQSPAFDPRTGLVRGLTEGLFPLLPSAGVLIEF